VIEISLVVVMVLGLNDNTAAHYLAAELVQLGGFVADVGLYGLGRLHIAERDL
jgi:hypothetical protein